MKKLTIAIDFDGVIVEDKFPNIGNIMPGAIHSINYLQNQGHTLILNTCRTDKLLDDAILYLLENGIQFPYINENCTKLKLIYNNDPRKIGADIYIDDKSIFTEIDWPKIIEEIDSRI